jgi:hypothetical protein
MTRVGPYEQVNNVSLQVSSPKGKSGHYFMVTFVDHVTWPHNDPNPGAPPIVNRCTGSFQMPPAYNGASASGVYLSLDCGAQGHEDDIIKFANGHIVSVAWENGSYPAGLVHQSN